MERYAISNNISLDNVVPFNDIINWGFSKSILVFFVSKQMAIEKIFQRSPYEYNVLLIHYTENGNLSI